MVFYFPLRKVKFMLYYKSCAGRIVAIAADCKSAAHWASLVRVQPGAKRKQTFRYIESFQKRDFWGFVGRCIGSSGRTTLEESSLAFAMTSGSFLNVSLNWSMTVVPRRAEAGWNIG